MEYKNNKYTDNANKFSIEKTENEIICKISDDILSITATIDTKKGFTLSNFSLAKINVNFINNKGEETKLVNPDIKVILLDECTNLNPLEWQLLSKIAEDSGLSIIATGDSMQRGYKITYTEEEGKTGSASIGDDLILGFNTPALHSVHRGHNSAVK